MDRILQGSVCSLPYLSIAWQRTTQLTTGSCYFLALGASNLDTPFLGTSASRFLRGYNTFLVRTIVSSESSTRKTEMCSSWLMWFLAGVIKLASLGCLISCRMPGHLQQASSTACNPRKSGGTCPRWKPLSNNLIMVVTCIPPLYHILFVIN